MNKIKRLFTLVILFCGLIIYAQRPFVTTWKVTEDDTTIEIPTYDASYRYSISWVNTKNISQKGSFNNVTGDKMINLKKPGIYKIEIQGLFPGIFFGKDSQTNKNRAKILTIEQWGSNNWQNFKSAFSGCIKLDVKATDIPNLSNVESMQSMFNGCENLKGNPSFNEWDTSRITDMSYLFKNCTLFNQPIGKWNTEKVTNMFSMFENTTKFNQNISNWKTGNVTDMSNMFNSCSTFNQPLFNWDTKKVTSMNYMFEHATKFNQDISNWNTTNVKTMQSMFVSATNFNNGGQPLRRNGNKWDTSNVTNMSYMFRNTTSFNQPIDNWNTAKVTDMRSMFDRARKFNQNISNWNTTNVTNMGNMFNNATSFNQPIGNWNTANVTDMSTMFKKAIKFNQNISNWNTAKVKNMRAMFNNADNFNNNGYPLITNNNKWNTSNVTNMSYMFNNATSFNQPIGNWNISKVTNMANMFNNAKNFNQDISKWTPKKVKNLNLTFFKSNLSSYHFSKVMKNWANIEFSVTRGTNWGDQGLRYAIIAIDKNTISNLKSKGINILAKPQTKEGAGIIYKEKNNQNNGYTLVGNKENGAFEWLADYTSYDNIDGAPINLLVFKRSGSNLDGGIIVKANSHLDNKKHIYKLINEVTAQQETLPSSESINNVSHKPGIIVYDASNGHYYESTNSGWERIDN